jgi:hypothetical protein
VSSRAALADALLITLSTPATWPLALATFLLRGGLLVVLLPIVVLPSPVSLGNVLGPALTTVVLSGVPVELALGVALIALGCAAWVVIGGLIAATLEAEGAWLVVEQADDARSPAPGRDTREGPVAMRLLAARLLAHAPTAVAVAWGSARLVGVAYRELTSPSDVVSPIALRVVRGAPEVIAAVVVVWVLGEIVGGLAARRISFAGAGVRRALRASVLTTFRHPLAVVVRFIVPAAGLGVILLPAAAAASVTWTATRAALTSTAGPVGATLSVVLFVALWLVGLLLIGVTSAWRAAVWSVVERDDHQPGITTVSPTAG